MKFRAKFDHGFVNRGCWHCAILKALYDFKDTSAQKTFFSSKCSNEIIKNSRKFTRAGC